MQSQFFFGKRLPVLNPRCALGRLTGTTFVSPCVRTATASRKQDPVLNPRCALGRLTGTTFVSPCVRTATASRKQEASHDVNACTAPLLFSHQIFDGVEWKVSTFRDHPQVQFQLTSEQDGQSTTVNAIADSGAQSNLWGLKDFEQCGFGKHLLRPVSVSISAANNQLMNIAGSFACVFEGMSPEGRSVSCKSIVYVSDAVAGFFLSYDTMLDLSIIDEKFPQIGTCKPHVPIQDKASVYSSSVLRLLYSGCSDPHDESSTCDCPQRTAVPDRPSSLPFKAVPENNDKMRTWLLVRTLCQLYL